MKQKGKERERERDFKAVSSTKLICEEVSSLEDFRRTTGPSEVSLFFPISQEEQYSCVTHTRTCMHTRNVVVLIESEKVEKKDFVLAMGQRLQQRVKD